MDIYKFTVKLMHEWSTDQYDNVIKTLSLKHYVKHVTFEDVPLICVIL